HTTHIYLHPFPTRRSSDLICDADNVYGASWNSDGNIFFGQGTKGILRVSANGGKPENIVTVKSGEVAHGPQVLSGGDALMFTLRSEEHTSELQSPCNLVCR